MKVVLLVLFSIVAHTSSAPHSLGIENSEVIEKYEDAFVEKDKKSEETDQTFSEVTVSQSHSEENPDCDESLEGENASLGPKISFSLEAFHILSEAFYENRTISEDETSSLSDLICAPQKDVKWFFLKLRHLVLEKNIEDHKDQISELLESLTQTPGGIDLITI